ncbi:MAG TPA: hypothetical protein VGX48_14195 [Pyrinomonadaceae bacterium]|jgi:hypothetical protein|nr:hypothetical protein [Pyrinomonadaceae bacterium]
MKAEQIAIVIEGVSFFFVTLDLFGKDKIEGLHHKAVASLERIKNEDFYKRIETWLALSDEEEYHRREFIASTLIIVAVIGVGLLFRVWGISWIILVIALMYAFSIGVGILKAVNFSLLRLLPLYVKILEVVIDGYFDFALFLFEKLRLEGLMLTIGAVLFLVSKTISYFAAA